MSTTPIGGDIEGQARAWQMVYAQICEQWPEIVSALRGEGRTGVQIAVDTLSEVRSRASLSEWDATTPTGEYINTVGALREAFATLSDDAPLIVQVVAQDKTVWNVWAKAALGKDCGFKWKINPAILSLSHPDLHTLLASGDAAPPRE